ncbi:anoctamin-like protein, partial [Trifolium medium]|nr:anoctamin-like protein [Trifolium medium]
VNNSKSAITLQFDGKEIFWEIGENLIQKLESENIVKQIFPLHDEKTRKKLLKTWAFHWWDFTDQPIDEIYSYYGAKIAIYFAFLGMYTRWLLFLAAFGLTLQLTDFRSMKLVVLPVFFVVVILWAVMFCQFWKRKNSALLAR